MFNIAIIGAGQLGSRHLQGLKSAPVSMRIQLVDPSEDSLEKAKERYEQIETNPQIEAIEYLTEINQLAAELDVVIVATGSKPRSAILVELLSKKTVRNLILEKVLFPVVEQYDQIYHLLQAKGLLDRTWVNCPRRVFEGYRRLRTELQPAVHVIYEKTGVNWGLGCNTIHFIDHYAFLTGDTVFSPFDVSGLDPVIHDSKRTGYVEFTGTIVGHTNRGNTLRITSAAQEEIPNLLTITADGVLYEVDETTGQIEKEGQLWGHVEMKYQSALTGGIVEQLLCRDSCELTPYVDSVRFHLAYLQPLVAYYNKLTGKNEDNCPIT